MRIVRRSADLRRIIRRAKRKGLSIGFVPTMGAFHEGHLSLIRRARSRNGLVVVSLFVNPIQFDRLTDFRLYPRTLQKDARAAASAGCDILFVPSSKEMYTAGFQTTLRVENLSRRFEGRFRPGHFPGVAMIVTKLFHLVDPDVAYFGQKDAQQARVVEQLIRDLNFDVRLQVLPTVREPDGLAMSSRNKRLSLKARRAAPLLFEALQEGCRLIECGERRTNVIARRMRRVFRRDVRIRVEYVAVVDPETFAPVSRIRGKALLLVAAWVAGVRLIDNWLCTRV